ncbi:MAG: 2-isopropylmalate synthase [Nitrospirae bacterium]|nr:2-isopropylmalate synthase [Nitrospirota bacterium]
MTVHTAADKYTPFPPVALADRRWPSRAITHAPAWCSVDLRDGNQALVTPMDAAKKRRMWDLLVDMGFGQIEVGFPSASDTEYGFVRQLIDGGLIPDGVTVQVLTPARQPHIRRTFEALAGARRAIVHLYNSTSTVQREVVFGMDREQVTALAVRGARWMAEEAARHPGTEWVFEYSPESFTGTEPDFAAHVVNAVLDVWRPTADRPAIVNLPATVEMATPNVFADQVEWLARHIARRDAVILSVHPHNDRGTAVAAAELAMMAGAQRVEGTLFGNGERTGNVDIVTLALNLHTQGIDPGLEVADVDRIAAIAAGCTGIGVHPRHPYAGELVFTAFSGSHQDAIRKGLAAQAQGAPWRVPYLPIDPADVGRDYKAVVRVNSQSGKGGAAFLLERGRGIDLPRPWQIDLGARVKQATDPSGTELDADGIWELFSAAYVNVRAPWAMGPRRHTAAEAGPGRVRIDASLSRNGRTVTVSGHGAGPVAAFADALAGVLGVTPVVDDYREQALGTGADATALALVTARLGDGPATLGAGVDADITRAALLALLAAVNRAL